MNLEQIALKFCWAEGYLKPDCLDTEVSFLNLLGKVGGSNLKSRCLSKKLRFIVMAVEKHDVVYVTDGYIYPLNGLRGD